MRKTPAFLAAVAAMALPLLLAPVDANASCQGRKNTGTVLGGLGGALIGNSVSKGGGGAVIGGLGGAVIGHEIAKGGCAPARRAYRTARAPTRLASETRPPAARRVYYDQYGNPVYSAQPISR